MAVYISEDSIMCAPTPATILRLRRLSSTDQRLRVVTEDAIASPPTPSFDSLQNKTRGQTMLKVPGVHQRNCTRIRHRNLPPIAPARSRATTHPVQLPRPTRRTYTEHGTGKAGKIRPHRTQQCTQRQRRIREQQKENVLAAGQDTPHRKRLREAAQMH